MTIKAMLATYERLLAEGCCPTVAMHIARQGAEGAAWYEARREELRKAREAYGPETQETV